MLNGGLWRVFFSAGCKLLILERETGLEPATSSLGSWHSTTELLPPVCGISYLTHPAGLRPESCESIASIPSVRTYPSRPENRLQNGHKANCASRVPRSGCDVHRGTRWFTTN